MSGAALRLKKITTDSSKRPTLTISLDVDVSVLSSEKSTEPVTSMSGSVELPNGLIALFGSEGTLTLEVPERILKATGCSNLSLILRPTITGNENQVPTRSSGGPRYGEMEGGDLWAS